MSTAAVIPQKRTRPLAMLLISYAAFIAIAIPDGVLNIAWTYMKDEFNVTLESLGVLLMVAMIGRLITAFGSGAYIARIGMSAFLAGGIALMVIGVIGYMVAQSWIALLIFAAVAAMGAGAIDAGLNTYISVYYTRGQLNWLHAAFGVGITIGPALATIVVTQLEISWRYAYLAALFPILIVLGLFVFTFARWSMRVPKSESETHTAADAPSLLTSLRLPVVLLSGLLFFAYGGVELGAGQLANTLFVESRGATQETAGFWISLYWASFTIGRILMGFVADRINVRTLLRVSMIGSVIGAAMLMINPTPEIGYLGIALMGFSFAPMFATLISETPDRVGQRHTNNTVGIQVGVVGLGGAALPYLAGLLARSMSLEIIGVTLFGGTLLVLAIHELLLRMKKPEA